MSNYSNVEGVESMDNNTNNLNDCSQEENDYVEHRKTLFEETVVDMVEHICEELLNDPDAVEVEYSLEFARKASPNPDDSIGQSLGLEERAARLKIKVPPERVRELIGKRNETLICIKKLAFKVANKHNFYLILRVCGTDE
jgi:predicted RNA-binding protein YlqC (UPF0109 family)